MRVMVGFRFVALGYALLVFLIAPSWLAADESSDPLVPAAVEESATTVEEAVPEVPEVPVQTPVTGADESDQAEAGATDERKQKKADRKAKAAPAKADEKKEPDQKEPSANASASASVTISDFKFTPDTVTVNEGDSVTWNNDGPTVHTATADDGSFDTGSLRKGESSSATFTQAGTITYFCQPHPFMKGKVIVQAASAGSGSGTSGGSGTDSTDDSGTGGAVAGDDSSSSGSGLPNTGGNALSIALLGLATLGLGVLMRRRRDAA
jgi:LPXTG-motif cell wall-anchored protein